MKILDCEQGSETWKLARCGLPTASAFHKIIQPVRGDLSKQAPAYADHLIAEIVSGHYIDDGSSAFMERGTALESQARAWYAFERDVEVREVGFVLRDDERVGCSPDGLVDPDGLLELKCPALITHIGYRRNPESLVKAYRTQVQGQLWICERAWCDLVSWNPTVDPLIVRVERDEAYIAKMAKAIDAFLADMDRSLDLVSTGSSRPSDEEHPF